MQQIPPTSQVQLRGDGYHRLLELEMNLSCGHDLIDLLVLFEIHSNNYYFDYYELQYRSAYPLVREIRLFSQRDAIPYEMIGDASLQSSEECDPNTSRLLSSDDTNFFGLELRGWNYSCFESVISLPIHFNYQRARNGSEAEYTTVNLRTPSLYWKLHESSHSYASAIIVTKRSNGIQVKRMFKYSYLGKEFPQTQQYFTQLNTLISNGSYQPIFRSQSNLLVRIPVGHEADYDMTTVVTHLITIAGLISLIFRIVLVISQTRKKSA